jgi:hypothetical protein
MRPPRAHRWNFRGLHHLGRTRTAGTRLRPTLLLVTTLNGDAPGHSCLSLLLGCLVTRSLGGAPAIFLDKELREPPGLHTIQSRTVCRGLDPVELGVEPHGRGPCSARTVPGRVIQLRPCGPPTAILFRAPVPGFLAFFCPQSLGQRFIQLSFVVDWLAVRHCSVSDRDRDRRRRFVARQPSLWDNGAETGTVQRSPADSYGRPLNRSPSRFVFTEYGVCRAGKWCGRRRALR